MFLGVLGANPKSIIQHLPHVQPSGPSAGNHPQDLDRLSSRRQIRNPKSEIRNCDGGVYSTPPNILLVAGFSCSAFSSSSLCSSSRGAFSPRSAADCPRNPQALTASADFPPKRVGGERNGRATERMPLRSWWNVSPAGHSSPPGARCRAVTTGSSAASSAVSGKL